MFNKAKINKIIGSVVVIIGVLVFLAYIPQIMANIEGNKSQPLQPLIAAISSLLWIIYSITKKEGVDWVLIVPNAFGVILGTITFITSF